MPRQAVGAGDLVRCSPVPASSLAPSSSASFEVCPRHLHGLDVHRLSLGGHLNSVGGIQLSEPFDLAHQRILGFSHLLKVVSAAVRASVLLGLSSWRATSTTDPSSRIYQTG